MDSFVLGLRSTRRTETLKNLFLLPSPFIHVQSREGERERGPRRELSSALTMDGIALIFHFIVDRPPMPMR